VIFEAKFRVELVKRVSRTDSN